MVRNEKMGKIFKKKFRGDFLGGSYTGGRVWGKIVQTNLGGMLGNKRQDRGKKNFRGPEILWGNFWGKCKKKGETFLGGVLGEL